MPVKEKTAFSCSPFILTERMARFRMPSILDGPAKSRSY